MDSTESGMVAEVSAVSRKALCARNSAGQPAGSPDERGGRREERTATMAVVVSGMVTWPLSGIVDEHVPMSTRLCGCCAVGARGVSRWCWAAAYRVGLTCTRALCGAGRWRRGPG